MAGGGTEQRRHAAARVDILVPAEGLRGYVTFYYFVAADGPLTDFLYPEWGNVRFALAGDWRVTMAGTPAGDGTGGDRLFGPTDRCGRVVTGGGRVAGFGLTPLGWHRLIGRDASALANRDVPLDHPFGAATAAMRAALAGDSQLPARVAACDALLAAYAAARPPEDPLVVAVDRVLRARPHDVPAFAAAAGVSTRTLYRVCLRAFGFAPKRLLRRQRFLDTLGHVRTAVGDPLQAALDPDYCDQAHFYRDFRDFMGMSPRAYFTASRDLMARAAAAQAAAGVPLSFRLPPPPA
jgi:AraC-like DNA-binding protein